jgi:hypothetical protein
MWEDEDEEAGGGVLEAKRGTSGALSTEITWCDILLVTLKETIRISDTQKGYGIGIIGSKVIIPTPQYKQTRRILHTRRTEDCLKGSCVT